MKKKWFKKMVAVAMTVIVAAGCFAGCGKKDEVNSKGYAKEINIMIWEGSYPDSIFEDFEKEYGTHVNISYITNTDEILAKLLANDGKSDYDFIDLESAYVKPFVDNDLLEKLDYKNIPNSEALDESCWGVVGDEKNVWILPMTMYRLSVK